MQLVLSARAPLVARYGEEGFRQIRDAVEEHRQNLSGRGIQSHVLWVDDLDPGSAYGATGGLAPTWQGIREAADRFCARSRRDGEIVTSVLIVGGHHTMPFGRVPNPVRLRQFDPDTEVLTDNVYGGPSEERWRGIQLTPDTPVGRLPEPDKTSVGPFVELIRASGRQTKPAGSGTFAFINREWRGESDKVLKGLPPPLVLRETPGHRLTTDNADELNQRFLYFNLHGFRDRPAWFGFDTWKSRYTKAVAPSTLGPAAAGRSTVFSEVCYGALTPGRTATDCCAMAAIFGGTRTFVGPTGLAYGSHVAPRSYLDQASWLAKGFFDACSARRPVGMALVQAKKDFADAQSALSNFDRKTLLQFVLLGDPSRKAVP